MNRPNLFSTLDTLADAPIQIGTSHNHPNVYKCTTIANDPGLDAFSPIAFTRQQEQYTSFVDPTQPHPCVPTAVSEMTDTYSAQTGYQRTQPQYANPFATSSIDCQTPNTYAQTPPQHTGNITPFSHGSKSNASMALDLSETDMITFDESPLVTDPIHIAHIHGHSDENVFAEIRKSDTLNTDIIRTSNTLNSMPQSGTHLLPRVSCLSILGAHSMESITDTTVENERLNEKGFVRGNKICDVRNGEVFEAKDKNNATVVIKKTYKTFGIHGGTAPEGTFKEPIIMHHLTVHNKPTNDYMTKFIDFFASDDAFYLVMAKSGNINLADFNRKGQRLMAEKKMKIKNWRKIIKYIFWQLSVIIHWLHNDMNCCHFDLSLSNIMLKNGNFIEMKGKFYVDPNIELRLIDFGDVEMFKNKSSTCVKDISSKRPHLLAPKMFSNQIYDAQKADIWAMGVMLYEMVTGTEPFKAQNVSDTGFDQLLHGNLVGLLQSHGGDRIVNNQMLSVMSKMLNLREEKRINVRGILEHEWMGMYWNLYGTQVEKKSKFQTIRNQTLWEKREKMPFYNVQNAGYRYENYDY